MNDIRYRVRELSCLQNVRQTDIMTDRQTNSNGNTTPPWRSNNLIGNCKHGRRRVLNN